MFDLHRSAVGIGPAGSSRIEPERLRALGSREPLPDPALPCRSAAGIPLQVFDAKHPWGFTDIGHCCCNVAGICPVYETRFLLKTGTCRIAVPDDKELALKMLTDCMKQIRNRWGGLSAQQRKADAEAIFARQMKRTGARRAYLAAAHWYDCDVDYEFNGKI